MQLFQEKQFNLPKLKGISEKTIEEHLKLYSGYVKNSNLVMEKISELGQDMDKNSYLLGELFRRFSFEYDGMRNHEIYFDSLIDGPQPLTPGSDLEKALGSVDLFLKGFKTIAMTRGVGWAVLWYDKTSKQLISSWVEEHHLGQLNNCEMILALDMWEHAFVADYEPSGKKQYVEDFFENLNWQKVEENFENARK